MDHKEMFPSTHQLHIFDPFYWLNSLDVQGRRLPEDVQACTSPLSGMLIFAKTGGPQNVPIFVPGIHFLKKIAEAEGLIHS
jgi:hypothetical protein